MPCNGRKNEEIVAALCQVEGREKVTEVCCQLGVSEQTFYRWKKQFAGVGVQEVRELRSLPTKTTNSSSSSPTSPWIATSCRRSSEKSSEAARTPRSGS